MDEEEIDKDEHWSYTIMGNWRALEFYDNLFYICCDSMSSKEREMVNKNDHYIPPDLMKVLIERSYDNLIKYIDDQKSRLAYFALGVFLMKHGGKTTRKIRDKILKYSKWKYERRQLKIKEDRILRMKYLSEFSDKVSNYIDGVHTLITKETLDDIDEKGQGFPSLTPLNYKI